MPSTRKRKRGHVQLRTSIPVQDDSVVTRVKVIRIDRQIRTTSTKVSIPVVTAPSPQLSSPILDDTPYSNNPDPNSNDPDPAAKKRRKGPSRSVAVRISPCFPFFLYLS